MIRLREMNVRELVGDGAAVRCVRWNEALARALVCVDGFCARCILEIWISPGGRTIDMNGVPLVQGHHKAVTSVSHSKHGMFVTVSSEDETLRVWDSNSNACVQRITTLRPPSCVAVSADGCRIAVGFCHRKKADPSALILEFGSLDVMTVLRGRTSEDTSAIAWSRDGKLVAVGSMFVGFGHYVCF